MARLPIAPIKEPGKILNYWKKEKLIVACIVFFGLTFNTLTILGPIYQGKLIDAIVQGNNLKALLQLAATFILLVVTIQLLRYYKRFFIRRFANNTSATMRLMVYNNIMHKSMTELEKENAGNLMTRAISDVDLCVEGMRKFTTEIFDTGVLMTAYLVSLFVYDYKVTFFSCLFIPLAMFIAEKLKTLMYRYSLAYRQKSSEIASLTYDSLENVLMYRANGMEGANAVRYAAELEDLRKKATKASILENTMQPIYNIIAMIGVVTVLYLGGGKVISGEWTLGVFVTYMTMFGALAVKASKAAKLFNSVQKSQISWKRIKPFLGEYQTKEAVQIEDTLQTKLEVLGLGFTYPTGNDAVLQNLSFCARSGEIIGITGPVASGKSTLGLALLGLYPYLGTIKIDGKELRDYTEAQRSQMISYLGHQSQLLSDSIYNNITMGSKKDISQVLQDVCFEEDLSSMQDGIHTLVGSNGIRLSGGQMARIALARALLDKKKLIILDDPFSAVDRKTEGTIIENLKRRYTDSIILIISHRLAWFSSLDRIILIKGCNNTEYGTHSQLMERSPFYATIYQLQNTQGDERNES
ncbi:ABC-type multidrug transport system, ATPase and permease component [Sphaerochaeta pleomorpha str. Grapes]|uniref:ABC-type multidrug transport system, ATPase and permease component n=1 Tax=Sphaerochaeta pleomorpha (strain ATCC BAA-1885 / DSM 22778 / Grapes) TaxID=158190 RepID=G8QRF1_SPHPG|nr:ABC transporter ATP-binding protein [Sphaerochaeta pleomorpha]AEV28804.1 ABC-type multidrug transport system, ATPase and permease component [Sphaerochaeta pleomorpha str. Grapes]